MYKSFYISAIYFTYFQKLMRQTIFVKTLMGLFCAPLICGCVDNQRDLFQEPEKLPKESFFDFNMNQNLAIDIDYGFKEDYVVLFEIYDQDPIEVNDKDGSWKKKNIEPFYRAATSKKGTFNEDGITIRADISEVWLSSDYLGAASPVKLTIGEDHRISFNQNEYIQSLLAKASTPVSRGVTTNQHKYQDDWMLLPNVDWNDNGRPNNLSAEKNIPPASVLYNIKNVFRKTDGKSIRDNYPEFFNGKMISDIPITKETEVSLVFVNSTAAWYNTVGYYTYPTGETPTLENIQKVLAFPNASPVYKTAGVGALVCGDEVKLKYWNEKEGKFEEKFPAGITIGWCLQGMGFRSKPLDEYVQGDLVQGMGTRYSTTILNKAGSDGIKRQRTVSLRDTESNQIVAIGFEDNIDLDYCDAIFYIHTSEKNAIDEEVVPPLPEDPEVPTDEDNYTTYSGILTFEDLWPEQGDYDMNDVMIRYKSKVYKSILTNRVYKIVDEFTPFHRGGYLINGFGYQLHNIANSDISDVSIEGPSYASKSQYMPGKTETGQSHPTILLFDNMRIFDGKEEADKKYTVTIQVNDVSSKNVLPPYNPFIFVESDKTRGREVHLVKYPPTDKANPSLLGTGKDVSRPDEGLYYVSIDLMPFALNMPISEFPIPEEGVRIDESYPKFATWVKSNGAQAKDWYKYPKK